MRAQTLSKYFLSLYTMILHLVCGHNERMETVGQRHRCWQLKRVIAVDDFIVRNFVLVLTFDSVGSSDSSEAHSGRMLLMTQSA
jgi:hypothetical protein